MKNYILLLLFVTLFYCKVQSQNVILNKELNLFSIKSSTTLNDSINNDIHLSFLSKELISNDTSVLQQYGIYKFEANIEDSRVNIFFKKNNCIEIFDISNFGFFMPRLIDFINYPLWQLSNNDKLKYINSVVSIYKNQFLAEPGLMIKEEHGDYVYYIDYKNYKSIKSINK